jgi:hypothetical protein
VVQVHAIFGVSLMTIQNLEVSLSAWVLASSFFLGVFSLHFSGEAKHRAKAASTGVDEEDTVDLKWVSM